MQIARGIQVPLEADSVESPEIRYGVGQEQMTCLIVPLSDDATQVGRVTFEGFDAIRCCRGEYMPYPDDWTDGSQGRYQWVFEVDGSAWLQERHEYEFGHYKTPLLEEYVHYVFSFHDEFVELIAKGIWFEKIGYEQANEPPVDHPLQVLPLSLPAEEFIIEGIHCSVRKSPLPEAELIERSRLCSQTLFQYYLTLEGRTSPSYAARLRTFRTGSVTRLAGTLFFPELGVERAVGREAAFRERFSQYVAEVAERRRQKGQGTKGDAGL